MHKAALSQGKVPSSVSADMCKLWHNYEISLAIGRGPAYVCSCRVLLHGPVTSSQLLYRAIIIGCRADVFPKNCPFPLGDRHPHVTHCPPAKPTHHPKRHFDRFRNFYMGPKCYAVQCIVIGKKNKIALSLGISSPRRRRTEPRP